MQVVSSFVKDPQMDALRLPPQSIEAEQSVLGGLLLDNTAWDRVSDIVGENEFYRADHRLIFQHIILLIENGKPADVLTVAESLERSAKLEEAGGQAYLGSLALNTPSAANIRRYGEIVRERSIMRQLVAVGTDIADSAYNPTGRDAAQLRRPARARTGADDVLRLRTLGRDPSRRLRPAALGALLRDRAPRPSAPPPATTRAPG